MQDFYKDEAEEEIDDFNFREQLVKYTIHWKWFVASAIICLVLAFLYLRYTIPNYEASTTILVKDEKKGGLASELSAFADLGLGGASVNNLDNEIEILKSRTLIERTIRKMNLNIAMVVDGNVVDKDIYKEAPIQSSFSNKTALFEEISLVLEYHLLDNDTFTLNNLTDEDKIENLILTSKKQFKFGEKIPTALGILIIKKTAFFKKDAPNKRAIKIIIRPVELVTATFRSRLKVEPISKTSSVVNVSITDAVQSKAEDFLNELIQIYNKDAAEDKNMISENTSEFIANRLSLITQELDGVEKDVESFKQSNQLTDIGSEAQLYIEGSNEYDKKGVEVEIQLNVVSSLIDFIKKSTNADLLPTNIITSSSGDAGGLITTYNQLVLDRNRILKSATTENPSVIKLDQQISSLKSNVAASLKRMQSNLEIQNRNLRTQESLLNSKIGKIPVQERQFRVIARQQKVKEELYLYLLQKREETAISLAATEPNARVIDAAKANPIPVSPKNKIVYLAGLILGLLIPFSVIYANDLLDNKIKSRLDLDGKTTIPFIGDVPTSDSPNEMMEANSRTSSAEALRIIRTNLEFMLNKVPDGVAKTIFLTSTFPKEGKTFVSVNLAATFALSGKKVLLIGMDIRNPRLDDYLSLPERGFTNYLSAKDLNLEDLIVKQSGFENFYVLPAGVIPPNPAELLMSKKVDTLFETIKKQYDYIIVDTAPVSFVADTMLIANHADTFIYVARANFLEKRMLNIPLALYKEKKLPNMCLLLNDTDSTKGYGYGYGYGYGVKAEKTPWYKKRFNN